MALSHEIISQFAKIINSDKKQSTESTIYGTIVDEHGHKPGDKDENGVEYIISENGGKYIKPDGSDQLIPITDSIANEDPVKSNTMTNTEYGDRAAVLIKNHTATITGNVSSPSASNRDIDSKIHEYDVVIAQQIQADKAYLQNLIAYKASIAEAKITELEADNVTVNNKLTATEAEITDLKATKIDADVVEADYAKIESLEALDAKIGSLDADVANIDTLMFGSASGHTLQTTFANAVIALLGDAQIKSAMIESLDAAKINAGSINTGSVKIESEDGKLVISDNTIQIKDDNGTVRVQMGKDATNDYSLNIWDADGKLMFSEGGITDNAIKEGIIRNDMISNEASIDAKKLDINSLFTEMNDDGTPTLKSTKVYFDSDEQTLDIAFKEMNKTVDSQGTELTAIQGKIESKIWQQDIDTATGKQNDKYSKLEQSVEGFKTEVSETYSTKDDLKNLKIGARNLLRYTGDMPIVDNYLDASGIGPFTTGIGTFEDTGEGLKLTYDSTGKGAIAVPLAYDGAVGNGETVTLSFKYRGNMTKACLHYLLQNESPNVTLQDFPSLEASDTEWIYYEHSFSHEEANVRSCCSLLLLYNPGSDWADTWVEIKKGSLKLEKGSKATDWTPAPEDMSTLGDLDSLNSTFMKYKTALESNATSISASVSSLKTTTEEQIGDIKNNITEIQKKVEVAVTEDGIDIAIQEAMKDGVKKVDTGTGIKFDKDGMTVNKTDSQTSTNINENGMVIKNNQIDDDDKKDVLIANKDGVEAKNLNATTYLIIGGRSRFENYENNGIIRTGCFWIGG